MVTVRTVGGAGSQSAATETSIAAGTRPDFGVFESAHAVTFVQDRTKAQP